LKRNLPGFAYKYALELIARKGFLSAIKLYNALFIPERNLEALILAERI